MPDSLPRITYEVHQARRLLLANGRADEALERLSAVHGNFATLALARGECFYVLRQFSAARREFARCLLLAPNSPRAEIMLELASDMIELECIIAPSASIEQLLGEKIESSEIGTIVPVRFNPQIEIEDDRSSTEDGPENVTEMDGSSSIDDIGLVSETLAELMERQGKYDNARKVYIQLSRLNPDKYEYFREKIEKLRITNEE